MLNCLCHPRRIFDSSVANNVSMCTGQYRIVMDNIISESRRTTIGVQLLSTAHVANLPYDTPLVVADAVCGADYTT